METTTARTQAPGTPARRDGAVLVWGGGVLHLLVLGLLVGGAFAMAAPLQAAVLLASLSLLVPMIRTWPAAALALTLVTATLLAGGVQHHGPAHLLGYLATDVVLGRIVATRSRRASAVATVLLLAVQVPAAGIFAPGPVGLSSALLVAGLALATAWMAGLLLRQRREHADQLRSRAVTQAVTAERLRIARELHDLVAHSIGVIAIQAGVGSRVIDTQPAEARAALSAIEATSRDTLTGLRRTLVALRRTDAPGEPAGRTGHSPLPGLCDLDALVASTAAAGVRADLHRTGSERPLPPEIELAAYRIVQEALTNVVRHAGTERCRVTIGYAERELTVTVSDEGQGSAGTAAGTGFGITGMRERAALLHGTLHTATSPHGGFTVRAALPLSAPDTVTTRAAG